MILLKLILTNKYLLNNLIIQFYLYFHHMNEMNIHIDPKYCILLNNHSFRNKILFESTAPRRKVLISEH